MALVQLNTNPSARDLKWFGLLMGLFFGLLGGLAWWQFDSWYVARVLWCVGAGVTAVYYAVPAIRRGLFVGWMMLAFPIGWILSHVLLAAVYYLVLTPIGFMLRFFGRDALGRKRDPKAESYWVVRPAQRDSDRYFRQF